MVTQECPDDSSDGQRTDPSADPGDDPRADYDYVGGDTDREALVRNLERLVNGDVRLNGYTRQLYTTDASAYEVLPVGAIMSASTTDVVVVVEYYADHEVSVLPHGGGTSLAGQAVNEAVVLDLSRHMDGIQSMDSEVAMMTAQAGAMLADLNDPTTDHGSTFGSDSVVGDRSVLRGAIGDNPTDAHSLKHGKTDYYVEECEVVLADGSVHCFDEVHVTELREKADSESDAWGSDGPQSPLLPRIYAEVVCVLSEERAEVGIHYPDLKHNVSDYNLDVLVEEARGERPLADGIGIDPNCGLGTANLARLFAGSEGSLVVVTEVTVSLKPLPETKAVAFLTYEDVLDVTVSVAPIPDHDPATVELIDDMPIDLALDTAELHDATVPLSDGTCTALLVELYANSDVDGWRRIIDLLTAHVPSVTPEATPSSGAGVDDDARAFDALEVHDEAACAGPWEMRKTAVSILLSRATDGKCISFIKDCAVPADRPSGYIGRFREAIDDHDANTGFYAHTGPGVLHVCPLVNTKTPDSPDLFETIANEMTDFVVGAGGSVSSEYGDGHTRTQWNRKLYGDRLWDAFHDLKAAFDLDWILNPGQVCDDIPMTKSLRFDSNYEFNAGFDPKLERDTENGFQGTVELCYGRGGYRGSRLTTGDVMCPTYRATEEEGSLIRGRANMFRQAVSNGLGADATDTEFTREVLDLYVGCKGCAHGCLSEVGTAKLEAEVGYAHHRCEGASPRDHLFAEVDRLNELGSRLAPLLNQAAKMSGAWMVMEKAAGIARERSPLTSYRESLEGWFEVRGGVRVPEAEVTDKVLLLPDSYTSYSHPDAGKATVRVLEAAGVHISIPDDVTAIGRPAYSKGFLDWSRTRAETNVDVLASRIKAGWDVVLIEPPDVVIFQSDYLDLLSNRDAECAAAKTYDIMGYLDAKCLAEGLDHDASVGADSETLTHHGHYHQRVTRKGHHTVGVFRRVGYDVNPLNSGCYRMVGSFGYEAEHHSLSTAVGDILANQISGDRGDTIVTPDASYWTQLEDMGDMVGDPPYPIGKVPEAVVD